MIRPCSGRHRNNGSAFFSSVHPGSRVCYGCNSSDEESRPTPSAAGDFICGGLQWSGDAPDWLSVVRSRNAPQVVFPIVNNKDNKRAFTWKKHPAIEVHPDGETRKRETGLRTQQPCPRRPKLAPYTASLRKSGTASRSTR
jgi:hypothetical protein